MAVIIGLVVLALLIGFVCYSNYCAVRTNRALPKEIADKIM